MAEIEAKYGIQPRGRPLVMGKRYGLKGCRGQSLIAFLLILPIVLVSILFIATISRDIDLQQRVKGLMGFVMRESNKNFKYRAMDSEQIDDLLGTFFSEDVTIHYLPINKLNTSIRLSDTSSGGFFNAAFSDEIDDVVEALISENPLDTVALLDTAAELATVNGFYFNFGTSMLMVAVLGVTYDSLVTAPVFGLTSDGVKIFEAGYSFMSSTAHDGELNRGDYVVPVLVIRGGGQVGSPINVDYDYLVDWYNKNKNNLR